MQWNADKNDAAAEAPSKAKASFLAEAKGHHAQIFRAMLDKSHEYATPLAYTNELEAQSWAFAEALAKQSYKNGKQMPRASRKA